MKEDPDTNDSAGKEKRWRNLWSKFDACEADRIPYKAFFFMFFGGIGAFLPYLALYFKQLGLSAAQAGVLVGIRPLSELFQSAWGWVGDKYKKRKTILQLGLVFYTASALIALAIQPEHQKCVVSEGNMTQSTSLVFSRFGVKLGYLMPGNHTPTSANTHEQNYSVKYQRHLDQKELNYMFTIILLLTFLGQIFGCTVFSLPEALVVAHLEDKVNEFGRIRLWGELSLAITTLAVGAGISATETQVCGQTVKNYFIAFYCFAGYMAAALLTTVWMKTKYHYDSRPGISLKDVANHAVTFKTISLLVTAAFLGCFTAMNENFGLWFLDNLGASSLMVGIAASARYFLAVVGYTTSPYFIAHFGVVRVLIAMLLMYPVIFTGISIMKSAWAAMVFYILQGGAYSLTWCSLVTYAGHISLQTGYTAMIQGESFQ